jgi:hypothetical protein
VAVLRRLKRRRLCRRPALLEVGGCGGGEGSRARRQPAARPLNPAKQLPGPARPGVPSPSWQRLQSPPGRCRPGIGIRRRFVSARRRRRRLRLRRRLRHRRRRRIGRTAARAACGGGALGRLARRREPPGPARRAPRADKPPPPRPNPARSKAAHRARAAPRPGPPHPGPRPHPKSHTGRGKRAAAARRFRNEACRVRGGGSA